MEMGQMDGTDPALRERIRQDLYIKIIGRDPLATGDAEGLDYWATQAATQGWDWNTLVRNFLWSANQTLETSNAAQRAFLAPTIFAPAQAATPVTVASGQTVEDVLGSIGSTPVRKLPVPLLLAAVGVLLLTRKH
jgi:hypothetical protein